MLWSLWAVGEIISPNFNKNYRCRAAVPAVPLQKNLRADGFFRLCQGDYKPCKNAAERRQAERDDGDFVGADALFDLRQRYFCCGKLFLRFCAENGAATLRKSDVEVIADARKQNLLFRAGSGYVLKIAEVSAQEPRDKEGERAQEPKPAHQRVALNELQAQLFLRQGVFLSALQFFAFEEYVESFFTGAVVPDM